MNVATIKKELLKIPELPRLVGELASALEEEHQRRQTFYDWVDENSKVEFINGEIIEHSPVTDEHSTTFNYLSTTLNVHNNFNDLGGVRLEKAMVSLSRNDYEPDLCFWLKSVADYFKKGQTHYPAPNWICEILSKGTEDRDRTIKFDDYAAHGVQEYWIVDPRLQTIEQYLLDEEQAEYSLHKKLGIGDNIESIIIKGFKIPVLSIFDKEANNKVIADLIQKI